jgi:hypothetical protein
MIRASASRWNRAFPLDATWLVLNTTSPALDATHPVGDEIFLLHDRLRNDNKRTCT